MARLEFDNLDDFEDALDGQADEMFYSAELASFETANEVLEDARPDCPRKSGKLADSGQVLKVDGRELGEGSFIVAFGGPDVPYAIPVHWDTTARHETGKALFLSDALDRARDKFPKKIAETWHRRPKL